MRYLQEDVDRLKVAPDLIGAYSVARGFIDLWTDYNGFEWATKQQVQLAMGQLLSDINVVIEDASNRELLIPAGSASEVR